jgi:hypothetical protein
METTRFIAVITQMDFSISQGFQIVADMLNGCSSVDQ